jgi:hypothetical protein
MARAFCPRPYVRRQANDKCKMTCVPLPSSDRSCTAHKLVTCYVHLPVATIERRTKQNAQTVRTFQQQLQPHHVYQVCTYRHDRRDGRKFVAYGVLRLALCRAHVASREDSSFGILLVILGIGKATYSARHCGGCVATGSQNVQHH